MALEGARKPAGTRQSPITSSGRRPARRVALLVDEEQLAELAARIPHAAPRPGLLRPDVRR